MPAALDARQGHFVAWHLRVIASDLGLAYAGCTPSCFTIPKLQAYRFVFTQTADGPRVEAGGTAAD